MDWDDLHIFLAIARHGTLSAAARALGVTQPTMGRRLAAMEERSGARLLQRLPGRFVLTPLGESILGNAERIEAEILAAQRMITGRDVALGGMVRLTTVDTLAAHIITPALAALQVKHPDIVVELVPDTRQLSLSKREADIALRMTPFEGHQIIARRVGTLRLGAYASRAYLARHKEGDPHRLVTTLEDQSHLPEAKWLHGLYPDGKITFRSNSREAMLWAAKNGAGIAGIARFRGDKETDLIRLNINESDISRDIWLGVHGDMRHMPRIRAVMDAVIAAIASLGMTPANKAD